MPDDTKLIWTFPINTNTNQRIYWYLLTDQKFKFDSLAFCCFYLFVKLITGYHLLQKTKCQYGFHLL